MSALEIALAVWGSVASLAWLRHYAGALLHGARIPWLERLATHEPARWPALTVVVPARDEARELPAALDSLLGQDYADLRVVLVDDRSTDGTGGIMDDAARTDSRVLALHVRELPAGWLGKVHALQVGVAEAQGEWLLFTDADVRFRAGALNKTVAYALDRGLDHLTLIPELETSTFWQAALNMAFGSRFLDYMGAARLGRKGSDAFVGVGAFNLVRRDTFERSPGFDWLRLEVLDDAGVGLLVRQAGGRSELGIGQGVIVLRWYASLGAMIRGLEKNMFAVVGHYRLGRALAAAVLLVALELGPFVALTLPWLPVRLAGLAAFGALVSYALAIRLSAKRYFLASLAIPAGALILAWTLARSAIVCWRRGGIQWRETFYPLDILRAGQRVRL